MRNIWSVLGTSFLVVLLALRVGLTICAEVERARNEPRDITVDINAWRAAHPQMREFDRIQQQMAPLRTAGKEAKVAAAAFVLALRDGQIAKAYHMTSVALHDRFDSFEFEEFIAKRIAQPQNVEHVFSESINGKQQHRFTCRAADTSFTLLIGWEENEWRITEITFPEQSTPKNK